MAHFIPLEDKLKKIGFGLVAGVDEAGRGPMAGPVVSAMVILKEKTKLKGLDDSKKLTAKNRERLYELILKNCVDYSIAIVSHLTIDKINIANAVKLGNTFCLEDIKIKPDVIVFDGKEKQRVNIPYMTVIKGDSKVKCVAAASVLAKVTRDHIMRYYAKKYTKYGFEKHMGYGTRLHRSNMIKFGLCEIHRKSYSFRSK